MFTNNPMVIPMPKQNALHSPVYFDLSNPPAGGLAIFELPDAVGIELPHLKAQGMWQGVSSPSYVLPWDVFVEHYWQACLEAGEYSVLKVASDRCLEVRLNADRLLLVVNVRSPLRPFDSCEGMQGYTKYNGKYWVADDGLAVVKAQRAVR